MRSAISCYFSPCRTYVDALRPAVVADPVVDYRFIDDDHIALVHIGDVDIGDVVHSTVVGEIISAPVAALVAHADIAEAIIDAAVKADIASPVAAMEAITPAYESPISGSPESTLIRWLRPGAGHPIVATRTPAPISGRPEITGRGDRRLLILRHRRWRFRSVLIRWWIVIGIAVLLVGLLRLAVVRGRRRGR